MRTDNEVVRLHVPDSARIGNTKRKLRPRPTDLNKPACVINRSKLAAFGNHARHLPDGLGVRNFQYDDQRRITGVYSETGALTAVDYAGGSTRISAPTGEFAFDVMPSGRIGEIRTDQLSVSADYDAADNLSAFRSGPNTVEFGRDELGRVSKVRYANGEANQYRYDDLGNRAHVSFGPRGAIEYMHDPSGNIVTVNVTQRDGEENRQTVQIGDMNRVKEITYEGAGKLDISYDHMGRAVSFDMEGEVIAVEYEGPNRIGKIVSKRNGSAWSPGDDDEAEEDTHEVMDARLEILHRDSTGASHQYYGIVGFDELTFELVENDPMEMAVSGLREARAILAVTEPLFSGDMISAMMDFEKPSNPVFQPLEYRSTNCCIHRPLYLRSMRRGTPTTPHTPGTPVGDSPDGFCVPIIWLCIPPVYFMPLPVFPPKITNPVGGLIAGGKTWGRTQIDYVDPINLQCREYCDGIFRLVGDIRLASSSFILVSTRVRAEGRCRESGRIPMNIQRTESHESRHANALIGVINTHKREYGRTFRTSDDCWEAANDLEDRFIAAFDDQELAEFNHDNFGGESQYGVCCPTGATKSKECLTRQTYYLDFPTEIANAHRVMPRLDERKFKLPLQISAIGPQAPCSPTSSAAIR